MIRMIKIVSKHNHKGFENVCVLEAKFLGRYRWIPITRTLYSAERGGGGVV